MLKKITIFLVLTFGLILFAGCNNQTTTQPTTAPITDLSTTESETTEVPTTQAATTVAPTTVAPTTEAPTTLEPTTVITTSYLESIIDSLVITTEVSENFYLPAEIENVTVTWSSNNTEYLSISNEVDIYEDKFAYPVTVIRPSYEVGDIDVIITGIFHLGEEELSQEFYLTILKTPAQYYLDLDLALIDSTYLTEDEFALPSLDYSIYENIVISLEITDYLTYLDGTFSVIRPETDTSGTITFDVVYGDATENVVLNVTIKKALEVVEGSTLFISQYVEGSSYNKYIEIYNPTAETVNLSEYSLETYFNGNTTATGNLILSGTLLSGQTIVIGHPSGTIFAPDLTDGSAINFNGNDAVVLKHNGVIIDSFGQIGNSADFAIDVTLIRMPGITSGDTDPYDVFTLDEWEVLAKDSAADLGTHTT